MRECLPVPMMNILNGGAHSDAPIDFQEFMIVPRGAPSFSEALRYGTEVYHALKSVLKARHLSTAIGDEGGFAPQLDSAEDALESISAAVEKAGYKLGEQIFIALDPAASEFYDSDQKLYVFKKSGGAKKTAEELVDYYAELCARFPIISIEDGCAENDWDGWKKLTKKLGSRDPTGRRRSFRHQCEISSKRNCRARGEFHSDQGKSDRHADGNAGDDRRGKEK